jgi:leader peptidase (prepilin peptidase)/N-methyltransferase
MFGLGATAFAGGLMIGSFLTVVAHRVPEGQSIVGPRSVCPGCGTQIAARDNIPVLSWLMLRGRSRCCGERISARYPLTELALGVLFVLIALVLRDDLGELALGCVFASTLVAVTVTDLERRIIPNKILAVSALIGLALALATDPAGVPERLIAALAAGGLLFLAALAYPRGMGMGDVKLIALMGLYLGSSVAPAMLIALAAGSVVGIVMMARHGAAARKHAIPFGPFLALGGIVALLVGPELIDWYLGTFA